MDQQTYSFPVGDITCIAAADGHFNYPLPVFFANAPLETVQAALQRHGRTTTHVTTPYTCLFMQSGGERILVDTGAGATADIAAALFPTVDNSASFTGQLLPNLRRAGVAPGDVDKVIITHAHPDHVGGMLDARGELNYPNADYYIARSEWDFWHADGARQKANPALVGSARSHLLPLTQRITFVSDGDEVAPGIRIVDAAGHTPGHIAVAVSSLGQSLLHISDLALHPLHLEHPDWYPVLDIAPAHAAATRARLLNQAVEHDTLLFAHHFAPFPALGHVQKAEPGWRWRPLSPA